MYQIIDRDLNAVGSLMNPVIKFVIKMHLRHSIDNILINRFFLSTIQNFIDEKDARYRYVEQIPHTIAALIYYVGLFCFSSIIAIFKLEGRNSYKKLSVTFATQVTFAIYSLYLSIIGSLSPDLAMNITLFCGKKIIEIFDRDEEETKKICDFIKNFWSSYRIRIQNWMLSTQKLTPQNGFNYQMRVMDIHRRVENLSDIKNLFQYALQLNG